MSLFFWRKKKKSDPLVEQIAPAVLAAARALAGEPIAQLPTRRLVYALALIETDKRTEGARVLQAASKRFPDNAQIQRALAAYRSRSRR